MTIFTVTPVNSKIPPSILLPTHETIATVSNMPTTSFLFKIGSCENPFLSHFY